MTGQSSPQVPFKDLKKIMRYIKKIFKVSVIAKAEKTLNGMLKRSVEALCYEDFSVPRCLGRPEG